MIIVIDIGNSNVDLSGIRAGVVEFTGEIATRREWGTAEYTAADRTQVAARSYAYTGGAQ